MKYIFRRHVPVTVRWTWYLATNNWRQLPPNFAAWWWQYINFQAEDYHWQEIRAFWRERE